MWNMLSDTFDLSGIDLSDTGPIVREPDNHLLAVVEWLCAQHGYNLEDVQRFIEHGAKSYTPPRKNEELKYPRWGSW